MPHTSHDPAGDTLVAALDIGGTKISAALVAADGVLLRHTECPTPTGHDAQTVMRAVHQVLGGLRADARWDRVTAVGIGSAGPVDTVHGTVSPVNIPAWRAFPLLHEVQAVVDGLPTRLLGDGLAMTAAEAWQGAAHGHANALCMVVSTGVGGGFVLDGRLYTGASGNAGHIGHICVDLNGEPCPCGSRGCLERLASGPSIVRHALTLGWAPPPNITPTAAAVAASARRGEPAPLAAFARAARALGAAIAAAAALVELDVVVIGGGVSKAGSLLFKPLRHELNRYATLSFTCGIQVARARLGTDAGLVGAAAAALGIA